MSFWTAVVIIVAIATGGEVYRARLKSGGGRKTEEYFNNFSQKLARLEDRIANLEMIVLEKEKDRKYDKL
ncbi:MAG: hypothetical protein JRD68_00335 [Deltaproteobacteria bacterium]|nr:hypothetical protein [Deltaproteobacteria bacterium]